MIYLIAVPIILWFILMTFLLTPALFYSNMFDKITKAKYRPDKHNLAIILDHLRSYGDQWSLGSDQAAFPKEGAKQIYLNRDKNRGWEYVLASFDSTPRPINGYFGDQIVNEIAQVNIDRERKSLLRTLHGDGPLLLK